MKAGLELKMYRSIHQVPALEWNSLNSENDIFHSHLFLTNLEDAKVENSLNWYLMVYQNGHLVCSAVLSSFIINLDIFLKAEAFVKVVRTLWPGFLKVRILMCGAAASFGQKNIRFATGAPVCDILGLICGCMKEISKQERIRYQAFKEFKTKDTEQFDHLLKLGFFKALSLPTTVLQIRWKTFEEYLKDLRHGYKRQILASLQKIKTPASFSVVQSKPGEHPRLFIADTTFCSAEVFHAAYLEVMARAESKLETFNLDFFRNYFSSQEHKLVLMVLADQKKLYGAAVLVPHGKELTFALLGKAPHKDEVDSYFNLMSGIINYAISHQFIKLNMGQTSYYPKARVGAVPEQLYLYFRSGNAVMHALLKSLNKVLFPATKIRSLHVFKSKT